MESSFHDNIRTSTDLVLYNPDLPHVKSHLAKSNIDAVIDRVFEDAMLIAKHEAEHLNPEIPLEDRRLCHVLPPLKGPYTIGRSSLVVDVPGEYSSKHGCNKKIGIEIFSPTLSVVGNKHLMQLRPGNPFSEEQAKTLHTHALDLDHLDSVEGMPVLIFSHGMAADPNVYRPLVEELASHGFVVLNLNHPVSSYHAPFSQEALDLHAFDGLDNEKIDEAAEKMAATQAANICFVVEQIRSGTLEKLPENFDPKNNVILAGHSLGGAASIIAARGNPEIAGCINLDGRLAGSTETKLTALEAPVLILCSEPETQSEGEIQMAQEFETLRENSLPSKYTQKMIEGVRHNDFTMLPILDWLIGGKDLNAGLKAHAAASKEMLDFMNTIKKKEDDAYTIPEIVPEIVSGPVAQDMDDFLSAMQKKANFSGTVLVVNRGEIILSKGYGSPDIATQNTSSTVFQLGSLSKQFTAACIMKLVKEGKLQLDDPINIHLPEEFQPTPPSRWDGITIHHLLNHSSGIPNITDPEKCPGFDDAKKSGKREFTVKELVSYFKDKELDFPPGTDHRYSNSAYHLLGEIIKKESGMSYSDFVNEKIFRPAGMTSSGYYHDSKHSQFRCAEGLHSNEDCTGLVPDTWAIASEAYAAGALYSTTEDLLKWNNVLAGNSQDVLDSESIKLMTTPDQGHGYGLFIRKQGDYEVIEHGGHIAGFDNNFRRYPETDDCILILGNNSSCGSYNIGNALEIKLRENPDEDIQAMFNLDTTADSSTRGPFPAKLGLPAVFQSFDDTHQSTFYLRDGQAIEECEGRKEILLPLTGGSYLNMASGTQWEFMKDESGVIHKAKVYPPGNPPILFNLKTV